MSIFTDFVKNNQLPSDTNAPCLYRLRCVHDQGKSYNPPVHLYQYRLAQSLPNFAELQPDPANRESAIVYPSAFQPVWLNRLKS